MNIIKLLDQIIQCNPDQTALIHGRDRLTYQELDQQSRAVGAFFQAAGVQPGQRALLLVPLGVDFYVLLLGLARIGVAVVLIDPALIAPPFADPTSGKAQLTQCCTLAQPDIFIGSPKAHLLRLTTGAIRQIAHKFTWHGQIPNCWVPGSRTIRPQNTTACRDAATVADDPALITFTSGSTGLPKGICRTHGFLCHQHAVLCETIPGQSGAIELNTLPVFILSSLARGITVVMPQSFGQPVAKVDAAALVDEITANGVDRVLAPPAFCQRLVDHLEANAQTLPAIRHIYTGGGPVFPSLLAKLARRLPNATVVAVYGSTEAEPIAHIDMAEFTPADRKALQKGQGLLAGPPVPAIELAILPDTAGRPLAPFTPATFAEAQLPPTCAGEIVVAGDHVQKGYLSSKRDDGEQSDGDNGLTKFVVGDTIWHRTGDAGYLDATGRLWLLGRCSARVTTDDGTIHYPFGLEAAAMAHDGVERAAFVEVDGKQVLAIQTEPSAWVAVRCRLEETLLQNRLTGIAIDRLQLVPEIPMDVRHQSKVLYHELRQLLE